MIRQTKIQAEKQASRKPHRQDKHLDKEPALYGTGSYKIRLAIGYDKKDRLWYVAELSDSLSILARGYGKTIIKALKDLERKIREREEKDKEEVI